MFTSTILTSCRGRWKIYFDVMDMPWEYSKNGFITSFLSFKDTVKLGIVKIYDKIHSVRALGKTFWFGEIFRRYDGIISIKSKSHQMTRFHSDIACCRDLSIVYNHLIGNITH